MDVIDRIYWLLENQGKKASELCEFLHINSSSMSTWKNRHTDPPVKYLSSICNFFHVTADFLLTGEESSYANPNAPMFTDEEVEMIELYRELPFEKRMEFKGEIKGYLKAFEESRKYLDKGKRLSI